MTWREKTVLRILLLVAKTLSESLELKREIESLSNHIMYGGGK